MFFRGLATRLARCRSRVGPGACCQICIAHATVFWRERGRVWSRSKTGPASILAPRWRHASAARARVPRPQFERGRSRRIPIGARV